MSQTGVGRGDRRRCGGVEFRERLRSVPDCGRWAERNIASSYGNISCESVHEVKTRGMGDGGGKQRITAMLERLRQMHIGCNV